MKKLFPILISCLLILSGCKDNSVGPIPKIDGTYKGIYSITHNFAADSSFTSEGSVTFEFNNGNYKCEGEKYLLPPFGAGKYSIDDKNLTLQDNTIHTADFDWSLILNGEFIYTLNGSNLKFSQKDLQHHRSHEIILVKQN